MSVRLLLCIIPPELQRLVILAGLRPTDRYYAADERLALIENRSFLATAARVSRAWNDLATPLLYQAVTLDEPGARPSQSFRKRALRTTIRKHATVHESVRELHCEDLQSLLRTSGSTLAVDALEALSTFEVPLRDDKLVWKLETAAVQVLGIKLPYAPNLPSLPLTRWVDTRSVTRLDLQTSQFPHALVPLLGRDALPKLRDLRATIDFLFGLGGAVEPFTRLRDVLREVGRQLTTLHLVVVSATRRPVMSLNLPALTPNLVELAFDPLKTPLRRTTAHGLELPDDGVGEYDWAKCAALDLLLLGDPTQARPYEPVPDAAFMLPARKHAAWLEVADRVRPARLALADFDSARWGQNHWRRARRLAADLGRDGRDVALEDRMGRPIARPVEGDDDFGFEGEEGDDDKGGQ